MMLRLVFVVVAMGMLFVYSFMNSSKISYHFYYWKSAYTVSLHSQTTPMYIKVLEFNFSSSLLMRKTTFKTTPSLTFVPVIYIDNPLWLKMRATTMVDKILDALKYMPIKNYKEIQIDCDWSGRTKRRYFDFLKLLKEKSQKKISATIRLHQVKYYDTTGIPPVDYGVLMYYNMSDFRDIKTKNYILDLERAKQYHYNFDSYPLPLNLALPLYSQATIIRFGEVVGAIEGLREENLNENFKKLKNHLYEVKKTHYFRERLLYEGDKLRVDEVSINLLQKAVDGLKEVMPKPKEIIFYRWGNHGYYGNKKLKDIVESW